MISIARRYVVSSIALITFLGLLVGLDASGGKGTRGHPISFVPDSLSVELALNGAGGQTISFTSQVDLYDVSVWIVPEIWSFVTIEPIEFEIIEAGQVYEVDLTFVTPEDTVPGCYEGTIHLRVGNRTVAKPLPVSIKVLDEWASISDWPYRRCDLTGSACNPYGSTVFAGYSLTNLFNVPGTDGYVLAGDVDGDWEIEIITTSGSVLNIYSGTGELEQSIPLPRDCQLSMLEDADGDGILDIGLGGRGDGFEAYIYKADGTLLKTLSGSHGGWYGDHSMIPLTISNGKVLVGYNAGYSKTPRGVASFDYVTGAEEWYYQIGPANGWYSLTDMNGNRTLDITMNSHTVHNGASGNGTTDGDIYLVVLDENGAASLSQKYPSPSNGWAMHMFADMDGDDIQEILGFEGHDPRYYPGQAQIHIYDNTGNTLHTFDGPSNTGWDYAVGDLDGDGVPEVVASARNADTVYILDNQLQPIDSASVVGNVKLICDLTGDGTKEIVLLTTDGLLKVLDSSLALIDEVQCGNKNGNVIASDVDGDGVVELLVQTDQLYVYSFTEQPVATVSQNTNTVATAEWHEETPVDASGNEAAAVAEVDDAAVVQQDQSESSDQPVSEDGDALSGVRMFEGHYYKVFTDRNSWEGAKEQCEQMGGYLACITSKEENDFIVNLARGHAFPRFTCAWIGASDVDRESEWSWISGEPLLMEDNLLSHGAEYENYLNLRLATGFWEDYPVVGEPVGEQWFVCEWGPEMAGHMSWAETIMIESATHHLGDQGDHEGSVFSKNFHLDATYETASLNIDFVEPWGPNYTQPTQISINGLSVGSLLPQFPPRSDPNWYDNDYNGALSVSFPVAHLLVEGTNVFSIQNGAPSDDFYFNNVHLVVGTPIPSITKKSVQNPAVDFGPPEHDAAVEADAVSELSDSQAGDEFHEQKSHFTLIEGRFTWDEANADADARGGHLATFASQSEWDEMVAQIGTSALSKVDSWIGGTDERTEGVWEWITGEPFEFSRWDPRQPDNSAWGNPEIHQNYTVIIPYNLLWDDRGSVEATEIPRFPYILELEQNDLEPDGTFTGIESWSPTAQPSSRYIKIADSQEDFSGAQGSNGWYYGYSDEGGFQQFPGFDGSSWGISTSYWTSIWRDGTHPNSTTTSGGKVPENHTTIRRWICAESGEYQIKGALEESGAHPAADGVTITIAGHVYELNEGDPAIEFQFNTSLDAGDIVDIELALNSNDFTDGTYTKIEIYRLGAPATKHGEAVETDVQSDLSDSQAVDDRIEPSIQPDPAASLDISIQGVWELPFDDGSVRYKTIGDGKWLVEQRDLETGEMVYRHGGSYTLDENSYVETVEYANKSTEHLIGNTYEFNVSVEGDTLHQIGIDNPWTEDWRWISGSTTSPDEVETDSLQQNAETKFKIYGLLCCANRPNKELKLNAIYWNPTDPLVTNEGEYYSVGDTVDGFTIIDNKIWFTDTMGDTAVTPFYDSSYYRKCKQSSEVESDGGDDPQIH